MLLSITHLCSYLHCAQPRATKFKKEVLEQTNKKTLTLAVLCEYEHISISDARELIGMKPTTTNNT